MNAESMVFRSLSCFVTICGNMYGSTEGSTGRAKPGKPCGVRVYSRNSRSNTVGEAPVARPSSPRDNLQTAFFTAHLAWAVFFCLPNCGSSRHSRCGRAGKHAPGMFSDPPDSSPRDKLQTAFLPLTFSWAVFFFRARVEIRVGFVYNRSKGRSITDKDKEPSPVFIKTSLEN